jgi:tetratricopeptide (TPR) repeat protein
MKLNIGCGKTYKEDYINIDAYDKTIADKIMPANDLEFSSNSIEKIQANQLIEHFGLIKSIYVLAEWFRVLKPGGELHIETPDLEKSFKDFIEGDIESRKNILTWIYGTDSIGMSHYFCFPTELLEMILEKNGFVNLKKSFYEKNKYNPTQRLICKKTKDFLPFQIVSIYRKKILKEKIVDLNRYYTALEQEKLIDFFLDIIKKYEKKKRIEEFNKIVINGAIKNVKMTKLFLEHCISQKLISKNRLITHLDTLCFLDKIKFQSILFQLIKESSDIAGTQNKTYQTICNIGKESIKKLLSNDKEKSKVYESLLKLNKEINSHDIMFFSYDLLQRNASNHFYKGLKQFKLENYKSAIDEIKQAINIDRNHLIYYWNLARLYSILKNEFESKKNYKNAVKLLDLSKPNVKNKLKKILQKEINNFSLKEHGKPLTEII